LLILLGFPVELEQVELILRVLLLEVAAVVRISRLSLAVEEVEATGTRRI
jgi:hypothetical protein